MQMQQLQTRQHEIAPERIITNNEKCYENGESPRKNFSLSNESDKNSSERHKQVKNEKGDTICKEDSGDNTARRKKSTMNVGDAGSMVTVSLFRPTIKSEHSYSLTTEGDAQERSHQSSVAMEQGKYI